MQHIICQQCGKPGAANDTVQVAERTLCQACFAQAHPAGEPLTEQVVRQVDATICQKCGADNGPVELRHVGNLPVCPQCEASFRRAALSGVGEGFVCRR